MLSDLTDGIQILDSNENHPLDSFLVDLGFSTETCRILSPEQVQGIVEQVGQEVRKVISGRCSIHIAPAITPECEVDGLVEVDSNIQMQGIVLSLADEDGSRYDLNQGRMIYKATEGVCGEYPNTNVSIIGIELKPTGIESETQIKAQLDRPFGDLATIYILSGSGEVISVDGEVIINLAERMGVTVDKEGNILSTFGRQSELEEEISDTFSPTEGNFSASTNVPKSSEGCQHAPGIASFEVLLLIAAILTRIRSQLLVE